MQAYSDPSRETEPTALPDIEVFYMTDAGIREYGWDTDEGPMESGWYWWSCFPGCLPASEPMGPFATQAEALADAQNYD